MKDFYIIQYVDAYYIYLEELIPIQLKLHEARGYVVKNGVHTVAVFIKEKNQILNINSKKEIVEGLVIPTDATILYNPKNHQDLEKMIAQLQIKSPVTICWLDMVYVVGLPRYTCSEMYTEGVLESVGYDHIVLRDPETIRTHPLPIKNHPVEKPTFYIIPKSFITTIAAL